MGASYGAVYFRTSDRRSVRAAVEQLARERNLKFMVAPRLKGWIAVYPEGYGADGDVVEALAQAIGGPALHVYLHDESLFGYTLYRDGRQEDAYLSDPDYSEEASPQERNRLRGRPEALAEFLRSGESPDALERLLHPPDGGPLFQSFSLRGFARLLGLPNALTCYEYLVEDEPLLFKLFSFLSIRGRFRFVHIPDFAAPRARDQRQRTGRDEQSRRLQDEGLLLLQESGRRGWVLSTEPRVGPNGSGNGFFVSWSDTRRPRLAEYVSPWPRGGTPTALNGLGSPQVFALSPSGQFLAAGHAFQPHTVEVWDLERTSLVLEREVGGVTALDFSRDGRHLLAVTHDVRVVFDLATGNELSRNPSKSDAGRGVFDPPGRHLVLARSGRIELFDWEAGRRLRSWRIQDLHEDREELEALRAQLRESLEQREDEAERTARRTAAMLHMNQEQTRKTVEEFRQAQRQMRANLESADWMNTAELGRQFEQPISVQFNADERLLLCATDRGVRVFEWVALLHSPQGPEPSGRRQGGRGGDVAPAPLFSAPGLPYQEEGEAEHAGAGRDILATAYDSAREQFLFAGFGGVIAVLDLESGRSRTLVDVPGRPVIDSLVLSRDGSALACVTQPQFYRSSKSQPAELFVWDYPALLARSSTAS